MSTKAPQLFLSIKGKDFNGNDLNKDSVHGGIVVNWKGVYYTTGNRYNNLVELYTAGVFVGCVEIKEICLVKQEYLY